MDAMERLRRQYFALYPAYMLVLPPPSLIASPPAQHFLLHQVLGLDEGADTARKSGASLSGGSAGAERAVIGAIAMRQPEDGYRRKVWRRVVDAMEEGLRESQDEDAEIDERFYEILAELMVSSTGAGPSTFAAQKASYRTFIYDVPSEHPLRTSTGVHDVESAGITTAPDARCKYTPESITLLEEQIAIQGGTTGLRTWTAALHLGHHIVHHPNILFPPSRSGSPSRADGLSLSRGVIELGAGTGFISVLLAQLGIDVVSTDLGLEPEPTAAGSGSRLQPVHEGEVNFDFGEGQQGETRTPLGRLRTNVALNHYPAAVPSVRSLDWTDASLPPGDRPELWATLEKERRTVVAADVIYDPDLVAPLVDTVVTLLGAGTGAGEDSDSQSTRAIISATIRNVDTFNLFLQTCQSRNLEVDIIPVPPMDSANPTFWDSALDIGTEVRVMRIRPSSRR